MLTLICSLNHFFHYIITSLCFSSLSDVYTHLTNYSINKNSSTYLPNEDSEMRQGHKWTLTSLWAYLGEQGIDTRPVLDNIRDLVSLLLIFYHLKVVVFINTLQSLNFSTLKLKSDKKLLSLNFYFLQVIKTIISSEHAVYQVYRANMNSHYVGYELFGFDILVRFFSIGLFY